MLDCIDKWFSKWAVSPTGDTQFIGINKQWIWLNKNREHNNEYHDIPSSFNYYYRSEIVKNWKLIIIILRNRSHIEKSDQILIRNISKDKKLPGTKQQPKYFGPYAVENVTKGHVVVSKLGKQKKIPFHLTKKYLQRISKVQVIYIYRISFLFIAFSRNFIRARGTSIILLDI